MPALFIHRALVEYLPRQFGGEYRHPRSTWLAYLNRATLLRFIRMTHLGHASLLSPHFRRQLSQRWPCRGLPDHCTANTAWPIPKKEDFELCPAFQPDAGPEQSETPTNSLVESSSAWRALVGARSWSATGFRHRLHRLGRRFRIAARMSFINPVDGIVVGERCRTQASPPPSCSFVSRPVWSACQVLQGTRGRPGGWPT